MAVQELQTDSSLSERPRRRRGPTRQLRPDKAALSVIHGVVSRSGTTKGAIHAVKAINTAWSDASPVTREAVNLLIAILELSDNVEEALAIFARLHVHYPSARTVLEEARTYITAHYPGSEFRLELGDEDVRLGMSFLYVFVPANDYPAFKPIRGRLRDWWFKTYPAADAKIDILPQRKLANV